MRIDELFTATFDVDWNTITANYWQGFFDVDGTSYTIMYTKNSGYTFNGEDVSVWDISFSMTEDGFSGTRVVGTDGLQFKIFSTVISETKKFINQVKPEYFMMNAYRENANRYRVYQKILMRFEREIKTAGYERIPVPQLDAYTQKLVDGLFDSIAFGIVK